MTDTADAVTARLAALGLAIPESALPAANYLPFVRQGNLLFVSGQLPLVGGKPLIYGRLGEDVSVEQAYEAAKVCAINIIGQIKAAGALGQIRQIARLGGFVACVPTFADHPKVVNGASDLMVAAFGDAGRHTRAAVGVPSLPFGVPVEVDALVVLEG